MSEILFATQCIRIKMDGYEVSETFLRINLRQSPLFRLQTLLPSFPWSILRFVFFASVGNRVRFVKFLVPGSDSEVEDYVAEWRPRLHFWRESVYIKIVRLIRTVGGRAYAMSHAAAEACTHSGWLQGVARVSACGISACSMWMMTRARSAISLHR